MTLQICLDSNSSKIDSSFVVLLLSLHPQNAHCIQHLKYQFSNVLFPVHTTKRFFHLLYFRSKYFNVPLIYPKRYVCVWKKVQTISYCKGTSIHVKISLGSVWYIREIWSWFVRLWELVCLSELVKNLIVFNFSFLF
jgi:hypothetical protein